MAHLSALLTLALLIGIAGGVIVDAPIALAVALAMSAAWAAALLSYARGLPRLQLVAVIVLVAAAGWTSGAHALGRALQPSLRTVLEQRFGGFALDGPEERGDEPILIEGRLTQDATLTSTGANVRLAVTRVWIDDAPEPVDGGVSLGVSGVLQRQFIADWSSGRMLRVPALLRRPARYLNEGLPDQERALARRGISLVGSIKSAALVEVVRPARWWEELGAAARARTRAALDRHVRPVGEQSAAIAAAILIGDRAGLSVEVERRLQEAGTYHVIAISGGNIAILAGVLLAAIRCLGVRGRAAALLVIAALAGYAVIAAGGASVVRATLMAIVYLAVRLIDQRTAAVNAISLTAGVVLLVSPLAIVEVGFWFTFGATVALVVVAGYRKAGEQTNAREETKAREEAREATEVTEGLSRKALRVMLGVLVATAGVELALAPVAALIFQRVTVAGMVLNLIALPAMTVVQLGAMAVLACDLAGLWWLAGWPGSAVHLGATALTESARLLDVAPWLTWRVPSPHLAVLAAYYAALIALVLASRSRRTLAVVVGALFLWIVAAPHARIRALGDGRLHLSVIDVGQGDALLVTFPNGRTLLVDSGGLARGEFDIGDRVVGPALRARGVLRLDYVAVTHGDADHAGGAEAVVRDFAPQEIWWGVPVAQDASEARLRGTAATQRAAWRTLQRGDRIEIGGVELRVHHPPLPDWERQRVRNNDSLVFELRVGRVSTLLTGDIEREVERELVALVDPLATVVLKVAHHGSGTSSSADLVAHLRPAVALIGAGRANAYGHPVPQVLRRLREAGAEVFRTDLDGQVDVITDGERVEVKTWTGRRWSND